MKEKSMVLESLKIAGKSLFDANVDPLSFERMVSNLSSIGARLDMRHGYWGAFEDAHAAEKAFLPPEYPYEIGCAGWYM